MTNSLFSLPRRCVSTLKTLKIGQKGMSRVSLLALVAVVGAAGAGGWWWSQRPPGEAAPSASVAGVASRAATGASGAAGDAPGGPGVRRFGGANRVQPVSVALVRKQDVKVILPAIGNIAALNTATVRTQVNGLLRAIRFKEGQMVKAGAVLAEIDPRSFENALAQVQAQLAKDQSQVVNAKLDLERYKDLLAKDSIAEQQVATQDALVRQLVATVQADQAQVDNARLQLSYTKITAPISGRVGLKQVDLGNMVSTGDVNGLVTINQTQPISVVFAVPEANLQQIVRRLKGTEPLLVEAWDREQRNMLASGKISTTDNTIDPATGTVKLKAEFSNADGTLFPNQFVNIKLQVNTLEAALSVPSTAVQRGAQGTFVYLVNAEGNVTIRRIRTGTTEGDWVSVQGELVAGDKVVTDGADRLREGAKVEVIAPQRAFGAGAGGGAGGPGGAGGGTGGGGSRRDGMGAPGGASGGASGGPSGAASAPRGTASRGGAGAARANGEDAAEPSVKPAAKPAAGSAAPVAANGAAPAAAGGSSWIDQLPPEGQDRARRMMERLPPEEAAKVNKMSADERRAFFQQMRERRQQQQSQ